MKGSKLAVIFPAALITMLAACGGSSTTGGSTQVAATGNGRSDSAHVAAQANEPRSNDVTAATNTAATIQGSPAPAAAPAAPAAAAPAGPAVVPSKISARHVLIQWMGSDRAGKQVLRTREQALAVAQEVLKKAKAGDDLGRLAVEYSDEPNANTRGGSLGRFGKGQMVGAFEAVAFKLGVGEISDVVETGFGFHIIQRTE
jgi:peptidyl-prolyl cis-trans isomerase NIMA-interacting 1